MLNLPLLEGVTLKGLLPEKLRTILHLSQHFLYLSPFYISS